MKRGKGDGRQGGTVREEETSARSRGGRDECKESRRKRRVQGVEEEGIGSGGEDMYERRRKETGRRIVREGSAGARERREKNRKR
jgi:hypothetical protein